MKTNEEAQKQIFEKANKYFNKKKQQKKIILNSLIMILIVPAILIAFSTSLFYKENSLNKENSVGGSGVSEDLESSTIPQKTIIYADMDYFKNSFDEYYNSSNIVLYKEEFFEKYIGQDVVFLVSLRTGSLNKELLEEFNNKPLKSAELYPNITWNGFKKIWDNFIYHYNNDQYTGEYTYDSLGNKITYGDFTFDLYGNRIYKDTNVQAEIDRMSEYDQNLREELKAMIKEYQYKCVSELGIKFADDLNAKNTFDYPFAFVTFEDIEKLKNLPFGIMIVSVPENIGDLQDKISDN